MTIRIGGNNAEFAKIVSSGTRTATILDHICAFLLAVAPILQHYKGLYENMGFTVLIVCFPILVLQFLLNCKNSVVSPKCIGALIPLLLFELYTALVHSISLSRAIYVCFVVCIFIFVASGCVNMRLFLKYAVGVASLATMLLVVQYISNYLFHYKINLRPFHLLVSQDVIWVKNANLSQVAGKLYRPAAFFLEPSHLFLYCFPILAVLLLSPNMTNWRRNKAILVTAGLLLSTSGFGIVTAVGLWGLYLLFYRGKESNKNMLSKIINPKTVLIALLLLVAVVVAYFAMPVFQRSVDRIFLNTEGSTAIEGRTRLASNYIKQITGSAILWGTPNSTGNLEFNLAGFFATYIKWGVTGLGLTYWYYAQGLFKLKKAYFWITAIILVISFFTAHTHGTFYMLYFLIFLMEGYSQGKVLK